MKNVFILALTLSFCASAFAAPKHHQLHRQWKMNDKMAETLQSLHRHQELVSLDSKKRNAEAKKIDFKIVKFFKGEKRGYGFQAYIAVRKSTKDLVVAFRGTAGDNFSQTLMNGFKDANVLKHKIRWKGFQDIKAHSGFLNEYNRHRDMIWKHVKKYKNHKIWVTGFSLGGALAQLCALDLSIQSKKEVYGAFMASPRVGGEDFVKAYEKRMKRTIRVALQHDLVPKVPHKKGRWEHTGPLFQLYSNGGAVKPKDVNVKNGSFAYHKRCGYRDALLHLKSLCTSKSCPVDPYKVGRSERKKDRSWLAKPNKSKDEKLFGFAAPMVCPNGWTAQKKNNGKVWCKHTKTGRKGAVHFCKDGWKLTGKTKSNKGRGKFICEKRKKTKYPGCEK